MHEARARGVRARLVMSPGMVTSFTGRAVLETAQREGAREIALAATSDPLTRFLTGNVTQELFEAAHLPTWLFGPQTLANKPNHDVA